jgi:hydrogenase maturation factor
VTCETARCITCADEGVELTVVRVDGQTAICRTADGRAEEVDVALVEGAGPGAVVLAHAGVALAVLNVPEVAA